MSKDRPRVPSHLSPEITGRPMFSLNFFPLWNVHEPLFAKYSGDPKSDHSKSGNIWNPDFLKVGLQMVWFSNGQAMAIAIVPTIIKPDHSK